MPERNKIHFEGARLFEDYRIPHTEVVTSSGVVETIGEDSPLDQQQLNSLIETENQRFGRGESPRENNTIYATHFMQEVEFNNLALLEDTGYDNWVNFVTVHYEEIGMVVQEVDPDKFSGGVDLRRLVVVKDEVVAPASFHLGWISEGFFDSNGSHGVWHSGFYKPSESSYWREDRQIDEGFLHEAGHRILHLPDMYSLDFYGQNISHPVLTGAPEEWRSYVVHERNDRGKSLMSGATTGGLDNYTTWLLSRRAKEDWLHDDSRTIPEGDWFFPHELAEENILGLGAKWRGADIRIFRTNGEAGQKIIDEEPMFQGKTDKIGDVAIGDPFASSEKNEHGLIPNYQTLLVAEIKKEGRGAIGYYDIGDFSLGLEKAREHDGVVRLARIPFDFSGNQKKEDYDWKITYTGPMKNSVFLPVINR